MTQSRATTPGAEVLSVTARPEVQFRCGDCKTFWARRVEARFRRSDPNKHYDVPRIIVFPPYIHGLSVSLTASEIAQTLRHMYLNSWLAKKALRRLPPWRNPGGEMWVNQFVIRRRQYTGANCCPKHECLRFILALIEWLWLFFSNPKTEYCKEFWRKSRKARCQLTLRPDHTRSLQRTVKNVWSLTLVCWIQAVSDTGERNIGQRTITISLRVVRITS